VSPQPRGALADTRRPGTTGAAPVCSCASGPGTSRGGRSTRSVTVVGGGMTG